MSWGDILSPRLFLLLWNIWCIVLGKYSLSQNYPLIGEYLVYRLREIFPLPELSSYCGISGALTWGDIPSPRTILLMGNIRCIDFGKYSIFQNYPLIWGISGVLTRVNKTSPRTILFLWNVCCIDYRNISFPRTFLLLGNPLIGESLVY